MNPLAHISFPALFFVLIAKIFNISYSFWDLLILIFFSVFPDFDFFYYTIFKTKKEKPYSLSDLLSLVFYTAIPGFNSFENEVFTAPPVHHTWPSHYPIIYVPLLFSLIIWPDLKLFLVFLGIFSHFILDSFFGGKIMWLYPFSKKPFLIFGGDLINYKEKQYFIAYKKHPIYKLEILGFIILVLKLISFWV